MTRFRLALPAAAVALAIVACSDNTIAPTAPAPSADAASQADFGQSVAATRIMELRTAVNPAGKPTHGGGGGGGNTGIFYHGGPVLLSGTSVVAVYWASSPIYSGGPAAGTNGAGSADGSLVGYFLNHLGGSPYFNINTTYTNGSGSHIANVVNYTGYWANNANVPADGQSVSDAQMVAMLQSGLDAGAIAYDPNTLYAIFSAGTVNLGGGFGTQYCAYHTHGTVIVSGVARTILYAAMPFDQAFPSACTAGTAPPNGDAAADAEVNTLAHETEETTTDLMGNAWFDRRGFENADKCAWKFGTTFTSGGGVANITVGAKDFLVQMNWVNSGSGGCLNKL